jgi:threonine/homoserine/homoserine lactone efflux protein
VFLDLLVIGLVITLEPIPLTAFILILDSKNGVRKGAAFVFGWLASLAVVVAITVLATGNSPPKPNTAPTIAALVVKIAIGVVLLLVALRQYRKMSRPKKPKKTPKWQTGVDNMSPLYAMGIAPLVQPWGLIAAGVATITGAKLEKWEDYVALLFFCLIASGAYIAAEIYAVARPERTHALLGSVRSWIDTHTDQVIIIISLAAGVYLISKSAYVLATSG